MLSREEFKARLSAGEGISGYDFDFFPKVVVNHLGMMHYAFPVFFLSVVELLVYLIFVLASSSL